MDENRINNNSEIFNDKCKKIVASYHFFFFFTLLVSKGRLHSLQQMKIIFYARLFLRENIFHNFPVSVGRSSRPHISSSTPLFIFISTRKYKNIFHSFAANVRIIFYPHLFHLYSTLNKTRYSTYHFLHPSFMFVYVLLYSTLNIIKSSQILHITFPRLLISFLQKEK